MHVIGLQFSGPAQNSVRIGGFVHSQLERFMYWHITCLLFFTAQEVLDNFRGRFIECVEALKIVFDLENENIIADGDLTEIRMYFDAKQQNEILHRRLKLSCDKTALMEV